MEIEASEGGAVRRRRKIGRMKREKTPDPNFVPPLNGARRRYSEDESSAVDGTTASDELAAAQTVSMQIRAPSSMSAHESKILRRRDKTFASAAARSHSQPREAERLSAPEAIDLLRTVKRSLSSPRHNDESSESELTTVAAVGAAELSAGAELPPPSFAAAAVENLSRLDQNLRRFEDERKRFEAEKRLFEREKHEHKQRYKQMFDDEERKRLLQSYRKLSDHMQLPADDEERRRMLHSLRLKRSEAPVLQARHRHSGYDESSTQFSSSDADADEVTAKRLAKQLSPVRRHVSAAAQMASVRGPPPQPPAVPERRAVSRNNSLSPLRPQRRSRTPEQRAELMRKLGETAEEATMGNELRVPSEAVLETDEELIQLRRRKSSLPQIEAKRKKSLETSDLENKVAQAATEPKVAPPAKQEQLPLLQRIVIYIQNRRAASNSQAAKTVVKPIQPLLTQPSSPIPEHIWSRQFLRCLLQDARQQWLLLRAAKPRELAEMRRLRNKCISHAIVLIMLCGFGGLLFRYTEGTAENIYKCEVRKVKRDFVDSLWTVSHNMREDDWKSLARQKLRKFEEELHTLQELGVRRHPGMKSWNFVNCILYCWTVITTIGYGHITPTTTLGRSLTIIYAIIGIPMFLIVLADFGKLFTRCMKFFWAYVRRLYYTGTCRQIRKQQQVRDAMSGFNAVYNMTIRRPSQYFSTGPEGDVESAPSEVANTFDASHPDTPTSPYPETFEVDDEFNLPISLASMLLISYILIGAFVYTLWEDWTYFEAFYFVFVSMSTIGFGDFVPNHPIFMMCSIIYLVFGLALTSMFINVVQIKLSDTFKQASAKIGATIGFGMASEMGDEAGSQIKIPSDMASVHGSRLGKIAEEDREATASPQALLSILRPPRPLSPSAESMGSEYELGIPPPLPRRQTPLEQQPEEEKNKKKRFFK